MKNELPISNFFAETLADIIDNGDLSQIEISRATGVSSPHLTEMKKGRRRCTPEYDLRLGRFFGTSEGFFLRLQLEYELRTAARELAPSIARIPVHASV